MKMVTNEKIFEYYKEKEEFPIVTEKFLPRNIIKKRTFKRMRHFTSIVHKKRLYALNMERNIY